MDARRPGTEPAPQLARVVQAAEASAKPSVPRRYPTLDLLRLTAVGMTLLAHAPNLRSRIPGLREMHFGFWLGVDLFMLISGWLLGGQLLREASRGPLDPRRFYFKRWMRTLPPYFVMLVVLYFGPGPQFKGPLPWSDILAHATFLQVYAGNNLFMVSWSLCVEEHFYLLLPALVWVFMKWPGAATVAWVVIGAEAISLVGRGLTYSHMMDIPYVTHLRWHGLFIGMGLAWVALSRPEIWRRLGAVAAWLAPIGVVATVAVMASIGPPPNVWMYVGAPTVGTWALALVFLACVHEASLFSRLSFPGLQYLGELTYAIYLTHDVMPRALIEMGGPIASPRGVAWRLGLVMVASVALHHLIERPALRLRDRLLRAPPPAITVRGGPSVPRPRGS